MKPLTLVNYEYKIFTVLQIFLTEPIKLVVTRHEI